MIILFVQHERNISEGITVGKKKNMPIDDTFGFFTPLSKIETGFGIEPKTRHARLPNGVEARRPAPAG
jgi:hypothetical protein